jgi:transcription antitermination factor NusB
MLMDTSLTDEDKQYITSTYDGVIAHFDELKALIAKYAEGYAVDRIFKPDLAVMLVCTYELKYATDIPAAVSISEAVEIAKKYSSEKSKAFVNGTMASIYKEIIGGNPV